MENELRFGERYYRRVGEKIVGQMSPPVLVGIWEMKWRHVPYRTVINISMCKSLDLGLDPRKAHLTKHAPDKWESAPSTGIFPPSRLSTS